MKLCVQRISGIFSARKPGSTEMLIEVEMTEGQMYDAVQEFQGRTTDATWLRWVAETAAATGVDPDLIAAEKDSLLDALVYLLDASDGAQSGHIPGCGEDEKWGDRFEAACVEARAAIAAYRKPK